MKAGDSQNITDPRFFSVIVQMQLRAERLVTFMLGHGKPLMEAPQTLMHVTCQKISWQSTPNSATFDGQRTRYYIVACSTAGNAGGAAMLGLCKTEGTAAGKRRGILGGVFIQC